MKSIRSSLLPFFAVIVVLGSFRASYAAPPCRQTLLGFSQKGNGYVVHKSKCDPGVHISIEQIDLVRGKTKILCNVTDRLTGRALGKCPSKPEEAAKRVWIRNLGLSPAIRRGARWGTISAGALRQHDRFRFRIEANGQQIFEATSGRLSFVSSSSWWKLAEVVWGPGRIVLFKMSYLARGGKATEAFFGFVPRGKAYDSAVQAGQGIVSDSVVFKGPFGKVQIRIETTSTLAGKTAGSFRPQNLLDSKMPWCEGVAGKGKGQKITYRFARRVRIRGFEIKPGYHRRPDLWQAHNRVKMLEIMTSNKTKFSALFNNIRGTIRVLLVKGPERVRWVWFKIRSVYTGTSPSNHTCMTMIRPF